MDFSEQRYAHAPIVEAVLDLRVNFEGEVSPTGLQAFADLWKAETPIIENLNFLSMGIHAQPDLGGSLSITQDQHFLGLGLRDLEKKFMVQARQDGFAFINVGEYPGWVKFEAHARVWWDRYMSAFPVKGVKRAALRYINRIEIPSLNVEPEDYFNVYLKVPSEGCLKDVVGFNIQATFPQNDIQATALVQQALAQPTKLKHLAIMLDVDLFSDLDRPADNTLWDYFSLLRSRKNTIFEDAITKRTRELIK